jgi:hypothetical protein
MKDVFPRCSRNACVWPFCENRLKSPGPAKNWQGDRQETGKKAGKGSHRPPDRTQPDSELIN